MSTAAIKLRSVATRWSIERVFQRSFGFTDSASSHRPIAEIWIGIRSIIRPTASLPRLDESFVTLRLGKQR